MEAANFAMGQGNWRVVTKIQTVAFQGIDAVLVDVQVQIAPGLPAFLIA